MTDTQQALMVVDAEPPPGPGTGALLAWTDEDLQALRQTVAKACNDSQFKVFILACRRLGLDPFARQITPIVQDGRMTPQVTIDGFRLIAERTRKYAGQLGPQWCGADGVWRDVWLEDGDPVACKVGILRRDFDRPIWGVARTKSYKTNSPIWQRAADVMIAKVAESLGLRKTFPQELSGVYTEEEMDQAHEDARQSAQRSVGTQAVAPTSARHTAAATATATAAAARPTQTYTQRTQWELRAREFEKLRQRAIAAGMHEDDWELVCQQVAGTSDHTRMRDPGKRALLRYVEGMERQHAAPAAAAADGSTVAADAADEAEDERANWGPDDDEQQEDATL